MSEEDDEEGGFVARGSDPPTSWGGAAMASKSHINNEYFQMLYEAGARGITTMAMHKKTGRIRDSYSPRYSRNKRTVAKIGQRYELNDSGKMAKFDVYCLKIFLIPPLPLLLGWQVLKKEPTDGQHKPIPPGDQGPVGVGLDEPGLAEGVSPEIPVSHD
jgi:hypothetical protein